MLRSIYKRLVDFHPRQFRDRFGDEMISIFDQARNGPQRGRLIFDGGVSLLRQWILRPEFLPEGVTTAPVAYDGAPGFYIFGQFVPRTTALIDGAIAAVATILLVISVMGYVWTHPTYMPVPGRGPATATGRTNPAENRPKLYWPPYTPPSATSKASDGPLPQSTGNTGVTFAPPIIGTRSSGSFKVPSSVLQSYVGDYIGDPPDRVVVSVTLSGSLLGMQVNRDPKDKLAPISPTRFLLQGEKDRWVEFSSSDDGVVRRVDLYEPGRHITARRK